MVQPHFIQLDGLNIATYERPGNGPAILFVHGNSGDSESFENLWDQESLGNFRLLALDLPGHGLSERGKNDADYSLIELSRRVAQFVEISKLENAIAFGHSLGGHIAIHALEFTAKICAVMVIGTAPLRNGTDVGTGYVVSEAFMTFFRADPALSELEEVSRSAIHNANHHQAFVKAFRAADGRCREVLGAGLSTYLNSAEFKSEVELLTRPGVHTALLLGEHESLVSEDYLNALPLPDLYEGRVVRVHGAAHGYAFESPSQLANLLSSFASRVRSAKGTKP